MTPIALGYVGAKHRDWSALAAFTISSAVCFLFFFTVTYGLVVELWYYGVPMTDDEKSICQKDPECDLATERAYVPHPLDSIPLFALQVLFGVSTYYGVQLWRTRPPTATCATSRSENLRQRSESDVCLLRIGRCPPWIRCACTDECVRECSTD